MSYAVTAGELGYRLNETRRVQSVLQNVALILSTAQGSVPMYRDFGLPTEALDLPMPAAKAKLMVAITEAIRQYEPRAEIVRISFRETDGTSGKLIPVVEVNVPNEES